MNSSLREIRINLRAVVGTDKVTNKKYNQIFQKEEEISHEKM
jgi:hypothetical protein